MSDSTFNAGYAFFHFSPIFSLDLCLYWRYPFCVLISNLRDLEVESAVFVFKGALAVHKMTTLLLSNTIAKIRRFLQEFEEEV